MLEINDFVKYSGDNRLELKNLVGQVVRVGTNGGHGVKYPDAAFNKWERYANSEGLVWAADWAWELVNNPASLTTEQAEAILNPHLSSVKAIDSEIQRLKARINELETAKKVLESL